MALIFLVSSQSIASPIFCRQLWENYCIAERQKFLSFNLIDTNRFFWRTYSQKEIDYLDEPDGKLLAYEMKYSGRTTKVPASFIQNYPDSE